MTDNIDSQKEMGSPLDFAVDQQSRVTMATVRRAVSRGDAVLAYQPVVQAERPDHAAFHEGLIRIIDETGRIVPLRDFLPLAETTELGRQIDCLSLSLGLKSLAEEPSLRLSINMSARSIGYPAWLRTLREGIAGDDSIGERLILEITESSAMGMPELVGRFMHELQAQGVSFALDDFGAGYTSFRYLRDFCFDMIKIDGQFIRDIAEQRDNQVLARALQSIAHHFDMFTVAESVETADDAAFLIDMGIDCLQGYYFGAPTIVPPWRSPSSAAQRS
ncbi:EAL domain-containing protein [Paracoccus sp. PS-1]|uniref:EAL domain-containing protein n=1 Tax=unclassified Paracoccus (in: a-proteobacteria) TaxID=2688777 RepID=UPI00048A9C1A|nr:MULTISPECIES: EAL domain-containing protein [unclassified Paracoccus (in: a-proteobacteria)]MDQ7262570.1 EAL domain-containing protein [Paracoccus sp. PS1]